VKENSQETNHTGVKKKLFKTLTAQILYTEECS